MSVQSVPSQPSVGNSRLPITTLNKILFGLPSFALAVASIFHAAYQTKYYVDDLGMGPSAFAMCNALVRSIDLFHYPVVGWLVDNTLFVGNPILRGRRKPFLLLAAPLVAACFFLLYSPPSPISSLGLKLWYCFIAIIYNGLPLSLSYMALGTELTVAYDEQASLFGWVHVLSCIGMIAGSMIPGIVASTVKGNPFLGAGGGVLGSGSSNSISMPLSPDVSPVVAKRGGGGADVKPSPTENMHLWFFPLFALAVALLITVTFLILGARLKTNDPLAPPSSPDSKRLDDGELWETQMSMGAQDEDGMSMGAQDEDGGGGGGGSGGAAKKQAQDLESGGERGDEGLEEGGGAGGEGKNGAAFPPSGSAASVEESAISASPADSSSNESVAESAASSSLRRRYLTASTKRPGAASSDDTESSSSVAGSFKRALHRRLNPSEDVGPDPDASNPCACPGMLLIPIRCCSKRRFESSSLRGGNEEGTKKRDRGGAAHASKEDPQPGSKGVASNSDAAATAQSQSQSQALEKKEEETAYAIERQQWLLGACIQPNDWTVVSWPAYTWTTAIPSGVLDMSSHLGVGREGGESRSQQLPPTKFPASSSTSLNVELFEGDTLHPQNAVFGGPREGAVLVNTHSKASSTANPCSSFFRSFLNLALAGWDAACCIRRARRVYAENILLRYGEAATQWNISTLSTGSSASVAAEKDDAMDAAASVREAVILVRAPALYAAAQMLRSAAAAAADSAVADSASSTATADENLTKKGKAPIIAAAHDSDSGIAPVLSADGVGGVPSDFSWRSDSNVWVAIFPRNRNGGGVTVTQSALASLPSSASPAPPSASAEGAGNPAPSAVLAGAVTLSPAASTSLDSDIGVIEGVMKRSSENGTRMDQPLPVISGAYWALRNIPFRVILVIFMLLSLASVLARSMLAFYIQYVLRPSSYELWLGILLSVELVMASIATPAWYAIAKVVDQKWAWILATALAMPATLAAYLTMGPGDTYVFIVFSLWAGLTEAGAGFLLRALRSTIVEYDNLYLGKRREAQYLTYLAIVTHWIDIPAAGIGLNMLAKAGYKENAPGHIQNPEVTQLIKTLTLLIPTMFVFLAWLITMLFPITRAVHSHLFVPTSGASAAVQAIAPNGKGEGVGGATPDTAHQDNTSGASPHHPPVASLPATASNPTTGAPSPAPATHLLVSDPSAPANSTAPGSLPVDPISCSYIYPTAVYRSSSLSWLLDSFSTTTLRQILLYRHFHATKTRPAPLPLHGEETKHLLEGDTLDDENDHEGGGVAVPVSSRHEDGPRSAPPLRKRVSAAACCGCFCIPPPLFVSVYNREVFLVVLYAILTALSIWLIIMGQQKSLSQLSWVAMLLFGIAGLLVMFHGIRLRSAVLLDFVPSAAIRRHLRL